MTIPHIAPGLAPMLDRVRELDAAVDLKPVRNQHLISRALLNAFARPDATGGGRTLHTVVFGSSRVLHRAPRGAGYQIDFVKFRPGIVEDIWGKVESSLPRALTAAEDGTLFSRPDLVRVLRDTIILHFVRSLVFRDIHEKVVRDTHAAQEASFRADRRLLDSLATQHRNGSLDQADLDERIIADLLAGPNQLHDSGVTFQAQLEGYFSRGRDLVASRGLEISRTAGMQFVLADVPVLAMKRTHQGLELGAPLLDATSLALPIGPTIMASFGPVNTYQQASPEIVRQANAFMIKQAKSEVHFLPDSGMERFIRAARSSLTKKK